MEIPDLLAANQKLIQLRQQARAARLAAGQSTVTPPQILPKSPPKSSPNPSQIPPKSPLNWEMENGSKTLAHLRAVAGVQYEQPTNQTAAVMSVTVGAAVTPSIGGNGGSGTAVPPVTDVKAYPSLLSAFLRGDLAAVGRVYLLIRAHDGSGRGLVEVDQLRELLTDAGAPWRVMTWRRLRQIMAQGDGLFWDRHDDGRLLRYFSPARIARALDCGRLELQPVYLPVDSLLGGGGIQQVRANFYAAWHSGRPELNEGGSAPVTRAVIQEVTGVPKSTQIAYEKAAGVETKPNMAITGDKSTPERAETSSWEHGHAFFEFVDWLGKRGRQRRRYIAWQMPNSFGAVHRKAPKGRQRKINKRMTDLVITEARGNGRDVDQLYYPDGAKAAAAYNKAGSRHNKYFRQPPKDPADQRPLAAQLWNVLHHV